jgi:hypothetical protein
MSELQELRQLVKEFSGEMESRLISKYREGWHGWDSSDYLDSILTRMVENALHAKLHRDSQSLIDTANLAMMVWNLERKIKS